MAREDKEFEAMNAKKSENILEQSVGMNENKKKRNRKMRHSNQKFSKIFGNNIIQYDGLDHSRKYAKPKKNRENWTKYWQDKWK